MKSQDKLKVINNDEELIQTQQNNLNSQELPNHINQLNKNNLIENLDIERILFKIAIVLIFIACIFVIAIYYGMINP